MKGLIRIALTFISAVASFYFVFWVGCALTLPLHLPLWITFLGSALVAALVARYVWMHTASIQSGLASSVMVGALATGGIGFVLGFFGPILLTPEASQGPLLGIFITGPLGFLLGGVGGAVYWFARRRRA